jgi:hypothetical protein
LSSIWPGHIGPGFFFFASDLLHLAPYPRHHCRTGQQKGGYKIEGVVHAAGSGATAAESVAGRNDEAQLIKLLKA